MLSQAVACVTVAGAVLLVVSGLTHTLRSRRLLASLLAHKVLPYRLARSTARAAPVGQLLLGLVLLVALLGPSGWAALVAFLSVVACATYAALAGYVLAVLVTVQDPTCACFGRSERVSWFSLVRAALPAVAFAYAAFWPSHVLAAPVGWSVVGGLLVVTLGLFGQRSKGSEDDLVLEPGGHARMR